MLTNVFKIGGLHQISWFQFLPHDSDWISLPDKSVKVEQKDAATLLVLSSHLQLQKQGFLSAWTNSFVGPWDPSQGLHNPGQIYEKIKLWLFLPGHHTSVIESAQAAVSRLRVVKFGLWLAPGDSEEVAAAISQALRNCIERALFGLCYMRFGDVFSKFRPSQSEEIFRRGQPTIEFIFAATEEGIFVHAIISSKHIRGLSSVDLERVSKQSSKNSSCKLPVIVSPHGIRGRLTGCCSDDLVKQLYFRSSKFRASNSFIGLQNHVSRGSGCQRGGQHCFVEVTLGCHRSGGNGQPHSISNSNRNLPKNHVNESPALGRADQKGAVDNVAVYEKTFLYPPEAVFVPVLQTSFPRSSLKRFWLQNWIGPSLHGSAFYMHCADNVDFMEGLSEAYSRHSQHGYNSSSDSNSSSISSLSSSSGDSDYKMNTGASELEADADSLTCRQSGLSSNNQLENDFPRLGSKRPRAEITDSFAQIGAAANVHIPDSYKSDLGSVEVNNSAITVAANEPIGSYWDWDEDDRDVSTDIRALVDEFGDFGDFFESDGLPFGEPPGTAESQTLMFSGPDCGDLLSSPIGIMDAPDQLLPTEGFTSFDSFNQPSTAVNEEIISKIPGAVNASSSGLVNHSLASSNSEFDHIIKAEALVTFAPEFGAVEAVTSELSSSIFRSPYFPNSRKVESSSSSSNNYVYGATPPSSPCLDGSDEKTGMVMSSKTFSAKQGSSATLQAKNWYTVVESVKDQHDRSSNHSIVTCDGVASTLSNPSSVNAVKSSQRKITDGMFDLDNVSLSLKTLIATEVECILFQASMCRIRHTLLSSSSPISAGLTRLNPSTILNQHPNDPSVMTDNLSDKYEVKKKESIPVRIAGDIDGGLLEGHLNAQTVGVWLPVSVPRVAKPQNPNIMEVSPSMSHNAFNEESMLSYGQRQPLQELLDGMTLLVQQATSFVDLALDSDCGDGPFSLLALQEQWRKGFSCGPSMVHAGCGGALASCHSLDIAGVELTDPLSADVYASSVISLLQSDIKSALKSAFDTLDGPLSITDWCKGRNQSGEAGSTGDGYSAESTISEGRDSSSSAAVSIIGEPVSPSLGGQSGLKAIALDGAKMDETCQRRSNQENSSSETDQQSCFRLRPTLFAIPLPSILLGYQDDWLKTSASSLQLWEKAPFEPYALQKPITYSVVCPDIDPLTSAVSDFFQQLGTVYETCKLGTHLPQSFGNPMEIDSGKSSSSGFVLLDCPQAMRIESGNASLVGSLSDYFLSLSNGWDLMSYLKSLSKALKSLKLGPYMSTNAKEGSSGSCMVIYVVCPFPEPTAILRTVVESSVAIGSVIFQSDRERRSILHSQVAKALSCSAAVDEASISNALVLSGFSVPKVVLQIVTVDAIFRVTSPSLSELVILKEIAFTVYNKARRMARGSSNDVGNSSSLSSRSHSVLAQMSAPSPGMWKDCIGPRMSAHSLPREGDIDSSLRSSTWDSSWQTRAGALSCDPSRMGDFFLQDENRYMFEPLFILAEPGSLEHGHTPFAFGNSYSESSKSFLDDSGGYMHSLSSSASVDTSSNSHTDGSDVDKTPSLHCCYGWTEDWRWLVCIWTDSRGELLDSQIFPFGGISGRQDTKGLECLFIQVLQQGCQILLACSSDSGVARPRDFVIARIGSFFELEYQEWQKAIISVGGSEVKKWPLQLRRSVSDGIPANSNGSSLQQQQEMNLIQERNLPSSPSPLYNSPHSKPSGFMKGSLAQPAARKQMMSGHTVIDSSKGLLQWVQSISFVAVSMDHSLHLVSQADSSSPGAAHGGLHSGTSAYLEGFSPVKSLGSISASYLFIPSPSMRFLPPTPLQLPTCLTAESPPLAHLLHSKGSAIPLSTAFVISKAVPSMRSDCRSNLKEEWPSSLSIGLIDYYGGNNFGQDNKIIRGLANKGGRSSSSEPREFDIEIHLILESVAAELQTLSWMTVSPAYLERRTALPFHCDMVLRLRRLLHFADKELSRNPEKSQNMV